MSGTVAVRPQPVPYYPVVTRKSDDSMVRMIQKYRNQYGLPEQAAEEIRTALLDLSDYTKDSQFIVVYAADALELTLTSDSRSFRAARSNAEAVLVAAAGTAIRSRRSTSAPVSPEACSTMICAWR